MAQNISASLQPARNKNDNGPPSITAAAAAASDWDVQESQRNRELEEARARAAQMEKTMKWWSDCTQNWREKWSKVRTERNKARDEAKQLRQQLEAAQEETIAYKRDKHELELQVSQLKREMEKVHHLMMKHAGQFNKTSEDGEGDRTICSPDMSSDGLKNINSEDGLVSKSGVTDGDVELVQEALAKVSVTKEESGGSEEKKLIQMLSRDDQDENFLAQRVTMLQLHLEEAQRTIQVEREEKNALHKNFEKFRHEFHDIREKCEELRAAKQEAVRELLTLQEQHRAELRIVNNTLHEETAARECLEKRLCDLRTELEKLQSENAAEWGKRERLETEKLTMERENKKLRAELQDLQDRMDRKGRPITNDVEVRTLQQELADKTKEIVDLKHSNTKMKKMLAEANTEMGHAVRRADQYEAEVKRLRQRVEELKRELATVEDELDATCNHVRRLQRTNEELIGQNEGFHSQIQQLQARWDYIHLLFGWVLFGSME